MPATCIRAIPYSLDMLHFGIQQNLAVAILCEIGKTDILRHLQFVVDSASHTHKQQH
jgi:hypothetical protein